MNTAEAIRASRDRHLEDGVDGLRRAIEATGLDFEQVQQIALEYGANVSMFMSDPRLLDQLSAAFMVGFACAWGLALEDVTE